MSTLACARPPKGLVDIAAEWDAAADRRHQQISSGQDLSFVHVLAPVALELLGECDLGSVLDVGCGTGELTRQVAALAGSVTAIDISPKSIQVAKKECASLPNVAFAVGAIEQLVSTLAASPHSAVLAAMTLMTTPDLSAALGAVASVLANGGCFVATVVHPCFWPAYWGYHTADWFDYSREIFIEAPFRISLDATDRVTTHVHRPLSAYLNEAARTGLSIEAVREPVPPKAIAHLYPEPWHGPRFVAFRWRKVG